MFRFELKSSTSRVKVKAGRIETAHILVLRRVCRLIYVSNVALHVSDDGPWDADSCRFWKTIWEDAGACLMLNYISTIWLTQGVCCETKRTETRCLECTNASCQIRL
jgi:hypothetical protein